MKPRETAGDSIEDARAAVERVLMDEDQQEGAEPQATYEQGDDDEDDDVWPLQVSHSRLGV